MGEPRRRRRRVRPPGEAGPGPSTQTNAISDEAAGGSISGGSAQGVAEPDSLPLERGLRGLVGSGSSQVRPTAALRARDATRPTPEDLAQAERDLVIVRRHWTPTP